MAKSYNLFPDPDELRCLISRAIDSHPEMGDYSDIETLQNSLQQYFALNIYYFGTDKGGDQQ
eukprot:8629905-Karenia_brevis.AAC.1